MLKIKLARFGKKKQPCYRIIVNEAWTKRDGKYLEKIGHYQPTKKILEIDLEAYQKHVDNGAQPTPTVQKLVERLKSKKPFEKVKKKLTKKEKERREQEKQAEEEKKAQKEKSEEIKKEENKDK